LYNELTISFELIIGSADLEPDRQNIIVFPIKFFDAHGTSNAKNFNLALLPQIKESK